jgi:foldase protein PrsA
MKKKILLLATLSTLLVGCGSIPKLENGQEVLVELSDGTQYSVDDIWSEFKSDYALNIILDKIDSKLLEEEFADQKDEIDEYVDGIETSLRANYDSEDDLTYTLSQYGYSSIDDYLETVRTNRLRSLLTTQYAKTLVTDAEVKKYYKSMVGDIEAVHILVKPDGTDTASDTAAKEKAESIIAAIKKDIKSGTSVEDAFKKYEDDDDVTYEDLGKFSKGDNVDAFDEAAFALKTGSYTTTPVKTTYGYHIILKTKEYDKDELEDVEDDIRETLASDLIDDDSTMQYQALNDLRKRNNITFYDSELESAYNKYMNYLLNNED